MRSGELKTQKQPKTQNSKLKTLKEIGEFGLIKRISQRSRKRDLSVLVGIGDDAAAINVGAYCNTPLLITTDSLVEDIHFKRSYPPEDIGWKALAVNISDIAAMGGVPEYYLLSLSIPEGISVEYVDRLCSGMADAAGKYGLPLIGGDTTASPDRIYISITVIGKAGEDILLRKGARPGDGIFVTGILGDSALGLRILEERGLSLFTGEAKRSRRIGTVPGFQTQNSKLETKLIKRHLRPAPRVKEGAFLAKSGMVTSMIDISDGLAADLRHICEESRVGARIYTDKLPLSPGFRAVSGKYGGMELALGGGEDYELLFTVRCEDVKDFNRPGKGIRLTQVGEITKEMEVQVIGTGGERYVLASGGYEHFKG